MPILSGDEMVRITNHGTTDLRLKWGKPYLVRAGRDGFIPFNLAKLTFGDPRSQAQKIRLQIDQNVVEYVPARIDELHRLALYYGVHQNPDDYELIKSKMPSVSLYTIDGDEIPLIVDDPNCQTMMGTGPDDDKESLLNELTMMRRRMMVLESHLASVLPDGEVESVTPDSPPQETAHRIEVPEPVFGTEQSNDNDNSGGWDFGDNETTPSPSTRITEDLPDRPAIPRRRPATPRPVAVV